MKDDTLRYTSLEYIAHIFPCKDLNSSREKSAFFFCLLTEKWIIFFKKDIYIYFTDLIHPVLSSRLFVLHSNTLLIHSNTLLTFFPKKMFKAPAEWVHIFYNYYYYYYYYLLLLLLLLLLVLHRGSTFQCYVRKEPYDVSPFPFLFFFESYFLLFIFLRILCRRQD